MFAFLGIIIFTYSLSEVHSGQFNASESVQRVIEDINRYITARRLDTVYWAAASKLNGFFYTVSVGPRLCGDFSTIKLVEEPLVNATYRRHKRESVYRLHLVLGLEQLFVEFDYEVKVLSFTYDSSRVQLFSRKNAWEIDSEINVRDDGFCTAHVTKWAIRDIDELEIVLTPDSTRFYMKYLIKAWAHFLAGTLGIRLERSIRQSVQKFPFSPIADMVCKEFGWWEEERHKIWF